MEFPALALFYDKVLTDEAPPSVELMVFSQKNVDMDELDCR